MEISVSKFVGAVTGIISVVFFGGFCYLAYGLFFEGEVIAEANINSINVGILGPKAGKAAAVLVNATDKITLKKKDLAFTESTLYKSFTDTPDDIPLSDSRGRPDPFVPYVAP